MHSGTHVQYMICFNIDCSEFCLQNVFCMHYMVAFCNGVVLCFCDIGTDFISTVMNYWFRMIRVLRRECYKLTRKRIVNAWWDIFGGIQYRNIEGRWRNHCWSGKAISFKYYECVCVCVCLSVFFASLPACESHLFCAAFYCHLLPVWLYHTFTHYLIIGTNFWVGGGIIGYKMCFDFLYDVCLKHFSL